METVKPTPAVHRALRALNAAENKKLTWNEFYKGSCVKLKTRSRLYHKMKDMILIVSDPEWIYLTFRGMNTLEKYP